MGRILKTNNGFLPSQTWIQDLARAETHSDLDSLLPFGKSFDPQQMVEESTVEFLTTLKDLFCEYAKIFNPYSEDGSKFQNVKVYSIAQTPVDFMVFRNQMKLIFSNSSHGVIKISYSQHVREMLAIDGQDQKIASDPVSKGLHNQELLAQLGPFRDVFWTFQGEKIDLEQVSRFYFIEFIKLTRNFKKLKLGNQILLDQIKTLLQDKGLNF